MALSVLKSAVGCGISKEKPEFEDVKEAAQKYGVPFNEVYLQAVRAITNAKVMLQNIKCILTTEENFQNKPVIML